jgi:hypothetical protein
VVIVLAKDTVLALGFTLSVHCSWNARDSEPVENPDSHAILSSMHTLTSDTGRYLWSFAVLALGAIQLLEVPRPGGTERLHNGRQR